MQTPLWIFGYGSLIWDPCFAFDDRQIATLPGWQRSFCMWSLHYRGTAEQPGLVLALDRNPEASCAGVAFRIPAGAEPETIAALRARELISYAYLEAEVTLRLASGAAVQALTYVINRDHPQYTGPMPPEEQAQIIAARGGVRGPNRDYLFATAAHLTQLGLADPAIDALAARVRALP
ncbi:MAG: gamma-glutamylcyclotransferase [Rhodobacteraceae bacterium]|jgi:cation transport protein ChaC|nr:gamma-glutamylcyclotransferase [Paracoccaceae bacterium]